MKREGHQHGMVRTSMILPTPLNPRPKTRFINKFDSPPTAGLFTKVSSKPTNHSKFTGKCNTPRCTGCRMHPVCKSKAKTKGTHKLKSNDVISNSRLISWRVADVGFGFKFSGVSASGILDHLCKYHGDDEYDYDQDTEDNENQGKDCASVVVYDRDGSCDDVVLVGFESVGSIMNEIDYVNIGIEDHDSDDQMSFCDVGLMLDQIDGDDEDWCLVENLD